MSGLFPKKKRVGIWWRDHSLSLVIGAILLIQTIYAVWSGAYVFAREQPLGSETSAWSSGFWVWWSWEYSVSILADSYGVLLIVVLSKWLHEIGSAEDSGQAEPSM